ncbi:uncharacterized protein G2W53_007740 [Senna tora]|uniref:Uncharacterized protein n=1 Tax=Senna tora TaxID=362788 RepID=A0A834X5X1_9FABA|nr:uncharacterized protein G2W53_007740 [Senna tora]
MEENLAAAQQNRSATGFRKSEKERKAAFIWVYLRKGRVGFRKRVS